MTKLVIDPVTRIEGHLKIETTIEDGVVKDVRSVGNMFRGIEIILKGRDPRDAQIITQRICGVCPQSHGVAAALCLDSAFGISDKIPDNARIIRNLIQGAHIAQDHILHFYHLAALDYVDVTSVADYGGKSTGLNSVKEFISRGELGPFVPRYEGDYRLPKEISQSAVAHYLDALEIRRLGHELVSIFGGKIPHGVGIVPGGITESPTIDKITAYLWKLRKLQEFIDNVYIPDVLAIADVYRDYFEIGIGCKNLLSYGGFDLESKISDTMVRQRLYKPGVVSGDLKAEKLDTNQISEAVLHSWYDNSTTGKHPSQGQTVPDHEKAGGYSWIKAPRYNNKVYEVGPLARVAVNYASGDPTLKKAVDDALQNLRLTPVALFSVMGRHLSRALCAKYIADNLEKWLLELKPGEPTYCDYDIPDEAEGMGLTEAARGALGHWIRIKDKKIDAYQAVVPTTWNASPKDDNNDPGPIEQAIIGTKIADKDNPFEIVRIVRSFDPCIACAVH